MTPLELKQRNDFPDYFNLLDDIDDFKKKKKIIRDRERCYICIIVDYLKSFF